MKDAKRNKCSVNAKKTHCINGHEFNTINSLKLRNSGKRQCRICQMIRARIRRANGKRN